MFSPGKYHLEVPTDWTANLAYRRAVLLDVGADEGKRAEQRERCKSDILYWINAWAWQFNPQRRGDEIGPFLTWDAQVPVIEKVLWCIEKGRSIAGEKSREMGGSYLVLLVFAWLSCYRGNQKFLCISRSAEAVDRTGDPDCLFWKVENLLAMMPSWVKGGKEDKSRFIFRFPWSGSTITGTASTGKAGVGGRATAIFVDEFPQITEDRELRQRTASTSDCRIFVGTHVGTETEFNKLCNEPEIDKFVLHWTAHPAKARGLYEFDPEHPTQPILHDPTYEYPPDYQFVLDGTPVGGPRPGVRSPWYDRKCVEIGSVNGVAMDLDINPAGSVSQAFDPILINELIRRHAVAPVWEGDLEYDAELCVPHRLVERPRGRVRLWRQPTPGGLVSPSRFTFGVDNSWGTGATPTCVSGLDARTGEKVLEIADPLLGPEEAAALIIALCRLFADERGHGALLCWEANGPGLKFTQLVMEKGYGRVYVPPKSEFGTSKKENREKVGWFPTPDGKDILLMDYQSALRAGRFLNRSKPALLECLRFTRDPKTSHIYHPNEKHADDPSGARVSHGDRTIADMQACMLAEGVARLPPSEEEAPPYGSILQRRRDRALQKAEAGDYLDP